MKTAILPITILCLVLAGCESPALLMTGSGPTTDVPKGGEFDLLQVAFTTAQDRALATARSPSTAVSAADNAAYRSFAVHGMASVYDNCSDFFTTAGEHEKFIAFAKDAVAFTGTLASGVLALANASKGAIAGVTLGTTTAYNGLDIYTKNFLFGADNIDSVRTLILNALDTHSQQVLGVQGDWTFDQAIQVILDQQEICRPSAIVGLVKQAIKGAKLQAAQTGAPPAQNVPQEQPPEPPPGASGPPDAPPPPGEGGPPQAPPSRHFDITVAP